MQSLSEFSKFCTLFIILDITDNIYRRMTMLSDRANLLMQILQAQGRIHLKPMAELFNVSERTVRNDLDEINTFLKKKNLPLLTKEISTSFNLQVSNEDIAYALKEDEEQQKIQIDFWQSPASRQAVIYKNIFNETEKWTIDKFEIFLKVSRSTVINDIKNLRQNLKKYDIEIIFENQRGNVLKGNEFNIREYYLKVSDLLNTNYYNSKEYLSNENELDFLINWLEAIQKKIYKQLSIDGLFKLIFFIKISTIRLLNDHSLEASYYKDALNKVDKDEFIIIKEQSLTLGSFYNFQVPDQELVYILQKFNSATLLKDELINAGYKVDLEILVHTFLNKISEQIPFDLSTNEELAKMLALHFQKTILNADIANIEVVDGGVLSYIQSTYHHYYEIIKNTIYSFPEMIHLGFESEEEIAFLTIHVVSTIEKIKANFKKNLKVLVVCHLGVGTSQFLKYRLAEYFNFETITSGKSNLLSTDLSDLSDIDFVITTINLDTPSIPQVYVSPSLNEIDIKKVKQIEEELIKNRKIKNINERYEPMLKELLTNETVMLNQEATNWQESIKIGGNILIENKIVEGSYVDAMVDAVEEFGPYIVIAPGIALAHASSKEGVNKIGMSLITLKEGVEFGSKANDPVKIVLCLAATDHNTHLKAMSELVNILDDQQFIDSLMQGNKEKALEIINTQK